MDPGNMEESRTALSFILFLENSLDVSFWVLLCRDGGWAEPKTENIKK